MKKVFLDQTEATMCVGVAVNDAEVILAGATIYAMPVKDKNSEYQRYADEYDIHFIFEDNIPVLGFYTIPQVDIFAVDSQGGYIGSLGQMVDLEGEAPICYIDRNHNCFLSANNGKEFLQSVKQWKTNLIPCTEVEFYASKEEAKNKYEFLERGAIEESLKERGRPMEAKIFDYLPEDAVFIRTEVFVKEQKFENELDDMDDKCKHIVLYDEDKPVGCCRIYKKEEGCYGVGRVAVLDTYRGCGAGRRIMEEAEKCVKEIGGKEIKLSAQLRVQKFYEGLGYVCKGEVYLDEYCPHIAMTKQL